MSNTLSNKRIWIHFAIMLVLLIGIGFLPPFGEITPMGMKILGVFVGTLYGWIFLDFVIASIIGLVFLGLSGFTTVLGAFQAGISNMVVIYMIIAFAFAALLNELNLTGALATTLLSLKLTKGRPWLIVFMLFFAGWLIAAFAETIPAILILWAVVYKIADQVGLKRHSKEVGYLLTGVIFFAGMGAYLFPFKPAILGFSGGYVSVMGELDQMRYYFGFIVANIIFFVAYLIFGRIIKFDIVKMQIDLSHYAGNSSWGKKEKWGLIFTIFFILFLALPVFLPMTPLVATWKGLGIIGAVVIIISTAYVITVDGKPLITQPAQLWTKGISWDLIFMIAATMPIGEALRSDEGGVIKTLLDTLAGAIGSMNWVLFTLVCMIALGLLTQIAHNLIIAAVLFPIFAPICADMGGDPMLWFIIMFMTINAAFTTPAASGWAAMLHGNSEWMSSKTSYMFGFSTLIVVWIGCALLIPIWTLVF